MNVLPAYMFVHHLHSWWLYKQEESIRSAGAGVNCVDVLGMEPRHLEQQPVLLLSLSHLFSPYFYTKWFFFLCIPKVIPAF